MISLEKLKKLPPSQRRRKLVLCLESLEKKLTLVPPTLQDFDLLKNFLSLSTEETKLTIEAKQNIESLIETLETVLDPNFAENINFKITENEKQKIALRACNETRHHLITIIGTLPAEWDLITKEALETNTTPVKRPFLPGLFVYAEDIRSPFNIGSIFRTAEAFGAEKLILSPFCASPNHTRAQRSCMGTIDILPWEQANLSDWLKKYKKENPNSEELPIMALETGGTPIAEFNFPKKGIIILGSEEIGIQSETLKMATAGRITIPMIGSKASLNVGVAFGVLMSKWTEKIIYSDL